jgi:DNA-directed RNA polymerase specialized sigma subunit
MKTTKKYTFQEPTIEDRVWHKERKLAWKRESEASQSNIMLRYARKTSHKPTDEEIAQKMSIDTSLNNDELVGA